MPRRFALAWLSIGAILAAAAAQAASDAPWSAKSEAGFVMARGNAETETANAKLDVAYERERWKHEVLLTSLYGRNSGATNAQRWDSRWQSQLGIRDGLYWFGALRYEDDRFSGFDYQASVSSGIGYAFVDTERTKVRTQIGVGYRRLRAEQLIRNESNVVIDRIPGETDGDAVASARVRFEHAFNDATRILDTLQVESGSENTQVQNDIALQVAMNSVLALSLGVSVRNNSNPPPGLDTTDTLTTVNLVYKIR